MKHDRLLAISDRWFRLLLKSYPEDFRDDHGQSLAETYRDRARQALSHGGVVSLAAVWLSALRDALTSGPAERQHPAAWWRRGGHWGRDLEFATRRLVRSRGLVLAVVGTLTVGLGAFAVVYTAVQKILLEPMPYRDPDDLYFVWRDYRAIFDLDRGWLAGPDIAALQTAGGVIEGAVGLMRQQTTLSIGDGVEALQVPIIATSPELFPLLGVSPAIGRGFSDTEVGPGRPPVIVLAHALWQRLGGHAAILGSELRLNGRPFNVIGVMPPDFTFHRHSSLGPPQGADAFITLDVDLAKASPNAGSYAGLLRARPGTAPDQVTAAVTAVGRMLDQRDWRGRGMKWYPVGLKSDLVARVRPALVVIGAAGVFLVLVLMVNLSSVLLARATAREREFAVSRALGANGFAIARATLLEGALLGLIGGITATLAAIGGTRLLIALAPLDLPRREAVAVTVDVAAVVIGVGILLGVIAAIGPALWAGRSSLASLLAATSVRGGAGQGRLRRALVAVQVALSLVLLTAGGLVVRSFDRLLAADPGFAPGGLLTLRVPMPSLLIPQAAEALTTQDRIVEALGAIPGVTGVSAVDALPLSASANQTTIRIPGAPGNTGNADQDAPLVDYFGVRAGYTDVMRMRVVAGRTFTPIRRPEVREILIDTHLAAKFFPASNPIGVTFPFDEDQKVTIVGVVEQARTYDVHADGRPQVYLRAEDWGYRSLFYTVRTAGDPAALAPDVRAAIRRVNPQLAVADVRTMDDLVGDSLRQQQTSAVLIAGFALGALLLSSMGLYAVVSASVTRRRRELSLRLALGADHGRVLRLVLWEGGLVIVLGLLLAVPGIYYAGRLLRGVLVGVSAWDPTTLVAVAIGLGLVALAACYIPARRVLGIQPGESLRLEG
jgi:putative ABC transport system permease protein